MIESEEEPPRWKSALSLVLIGSLIVLVFLIGKIVHRVRLLRLFVTESGLLLFIGFIVGLINHLTGNNFGDFLQFNTFLFDFIIIPIIIFESGYSLKKKGLFSNLLSIVLYAVLGTLISALFIGFMLFVFAKYAGVDSVDVKTPIEALIFGSIISAIDPVASLAILSDVFGVKYKSDAPRLYTVIFGESVINDAVSIVLFRIFFKNINTTEFGASHFFTMFAMFFYVCLGSVIMGIVIGLISALFFKYISFRDNPPVEMIILIFWAYGSYLLAEAASFSGIMTLFVCGIVMGRYTWHNLGDYSKLSTPQTFKSFAVIADAYVFLYLGLSVFGFSDIHQWKVGFISVALLLCLVARFLNIVPLTLLVNLWRKEKFNWRETVMLWFTGLRGAIAFALAIHTVGVTPNGNEILTTTLAIVMISVWVIGGLSFPMLRLLKLEPPQEEHHNQSNVASSILLVNKGPNIVHDQLSENGDINEQVVLGHPKVDTWMKRINKRFLVPFFRRAEDRDKTLRDSLFAGTIADDMVVMEANQTEFSEIKVVIDSKVGENRSRLRIEEYVDETQNDSTIDVELDQE